MLSIEQIRIEFLTFLGLKGATQRFSDELNRHKNITISEYVVEQMQSFGRYKYLMRNLISDAFAFMNSIYGVKYWNDLQKEWHYVCENLAPLDRNKPIIAPKRKQLYNSLW
jgi:hypothetical protein